MRGGLHQPRPPADRPRAIGGRDVASVGFDLSVSRLGRCDEGGAEGANPGR